MDKLKMSLLGMGFLGLSQLVKNNKNEDKYVRLAEEIDQITPGILLNNFTSNEYRVSFKYPKGWMKNPRYENKYEGESGFFEVDDLAGTGENIDEVVQQQINEPYKPYGTDPIVRSFVVDGQPARVIYPSKDQQAFFIDKDTAIIVKYPVPITIDDKQYDYVVIWVSKEYVPLILSTLKFNE